MAFMTMTWKWADPSMGFLGLVIVGLLLCWSLVSQYRRKKIQSQVHGRALKVLFFEVSAFRHLVRKISFIMGFFFLVLALMRLQSPGGRIEIRSEGIEIMILADVSTSMMAEDLRPNRLSQMKYDLMRFVDLLGGHRVGLIAFAGSAHVLSPLTQDPSALKMYIDSLNTESVSSQGTSVAPAIQAGMDAFDRGGHEVTEKSKVARAFLIVSDGEDHEPEAIEKAKNSLSEKDIRVFTIAYGTEEGASIPERDSLGYLRGSKQDRRGETILSKVNGEFLKALAQSGGGDFAYSVAGGDHIKKILAQINQIEKRLNQSESAIHYHEHYLVFAWLSFFHFLVALFLPLKKRPSKKWQGRSWGWIWGAITFLSFQPSYGDIDSFSGWYHYKKGISFLKEDQFQKGFEVLSKGLAFDPQSSEMQNALGVLFLKTEQFDQAVAAFRTAESLAQSIEQQFSARFNLGVTYQSKKDIPLALEAYLSALEVYPESQETKVNIELLIQKMQSKGQKGKKPPKEKNQGEDQNEEQDQEDSDNNEEEDQDQKDSEESKKDQAQDPKRYKQSLKKEPKPFKSEDLSEADMKRILDELRNQEQKIRNEYNKKEQKEKRHEKDW
jgi:Ca-activated chloride channel homolog